MSTGKRLNEIVIRRTVKNNLQVGYGVAEKHVVNDVTAVILDTPADDSTVVLRNVVKAIHNVYGPSDVASTVARRIYLEVFNDED